MPADFLFYTAWLDWQPHFMLAYFDAPTPLSCQCPSLQGSSFFDFSWHQSPWSSEGRTRDWTGITPSHLYRKNIWNVCISIIISLQIGHTHCHVCKFILPKGSRRGFEGSSHLSVYIEGFSVLVMFPSRLCLCSWFVGSLCVLSSWLDILSIAMNNTQTLSLHRWFTTINAPPCYT